jgi:hypothetical protein
VVSGALSLAARYGWISFNPARLSRPPAAENDKRPVPTPAEVREALAAAEQEDPTFSPPWRRRTRAPGSSSLIRVTGRRGGALVESQQVPQTAFRDRDAKQD